MFRDDGEFPSSQGGGEIIAVEGERKRNYRRSMTEFPAVFSARPGSAFTARQPGNKSTPPSSARLPLPSRVYIALYEPLKLTVASVTAVGSTRVCINQTLD